MAISLPPPPPLPTLSNHLQSRQKHELSKNNADNSNSEHDDDFLQEGRLSFY